MSKEANKIFVGGVYWDAEKIEALIRNHTNQNVEAAKSLRESLVLIQKLEAENKRLRACCKDFEFVLEGSRAVKQSDEMLEKREDALMRALDWDNPRKALSSGGE